MIRALFTLVFLPVFCLGSPTSDPEAEFLAMANTYVAENISHLEVLAKELESQPLTVTEISYIEPDIWSVDDGIYKKYINQSAALAKAFQETNIQAIRRSQKDYVPSNDHLRISMGTASIIDEDIGAQLLYKISSIPELGCTQSKVKFYKNNCIIHLNNRWYVNYSVLSKEKL